MRTRRWFRPLSVVFGLALAGGCSGEAGTTTLDAAGLDVGPDVGARDATIADAAQRDAVASDDATLARDGAMDASATDDVGIDAGADPDASNDAAAAPDTDGCDPSSGVTSACTIATPLGVCDGERACLGTGAWGTCAPPSTVDLPDAAFTDANCDGIDGDLSRAIFVATVGLDDASCGLTPTASCRTISHGSARAAAVGRDQVLVQAGRYDEVVVLASGVGVFGGYDATWQRGARESVGHVVTLHGALDASGEYIAMVAHDLAVPVVVAELVVEGPDALGTSAGSGRSSYGVHVRAATLTLDHLRIVGGSGASGALGAAGADAVFVDAQPYMTGGRGGDGREYSTPCDAASRGGGGASGTNTCSSSPSTRSTNGGSGGAGGPMDGSCVSGACGDCTAQAGANGMQAAYRSGSFGASGGGGSGGASCGPTTPAGAGQVVDGAAGVATVGGSVVGGFWYARAGGAGGTGENGGGGGGGGGAGGCDLGVDSYGAGGGGGGAGGCAARRGGGGGGGGGGSFGVFVETGSVTLSRCEIQRGVGGTGGDGGVGGRGQTGGMGGAGGATGAPDAATAGAGAEGAHGAHAGGGAGGQGGRSVGVAWLPAASVTVDATFAGGTAGGGGMGGLSAPSAPMRDGNDGSAGPSGTVDDVLACAGTTSC